MELSRFLFLLVFVLTFARAQDSPNDDEDDALPSCAASCSAALGNLGSACGNSGARSTFQSCVRGTSCSDDDKEGSNDWITSTCRVISREATRTSMSASRTSAASASTTPASTSATRTSSARTTSATSSSTITATSTPTPTADADPSGLSTGAKAGIGVGVALGVLLVAAAIAYFCARRMRQSRIASKGMWPAALVADKGNRDSDGSERGLGRYDPQDPYSEFRPHPEAPELGGVMRSELGGQAIAGAAAGAAGGATATQMRERPRGSFVHELPVEGSAIAGPISPSRQDVQHRIPRKMPVATGAEGAVSPVEPSSAGLLSPTSNEERPISTVSNASDPADIPLPMSPVSPTNGHSSQ